ncbi:F-box family-5 [Panicum miliaceum]|uniref:F-box family-5 n=1 Tax=Panicum miliaceum TaxID=4540 RepID=A0A3L6PMF3_PANMI|nr:F-box family-5 [Panicum miliaceum]
MPQQHVKVSGRRNRRRAPTVGIDTLPDEVLWRMLSFFPVREAVQTCVLGRRWRHLWRYMPVMRIVSGDGSLTQKDVKDMNRCDNCGDNGRRNENCMLLNGLSNAESLELVAPPGEEPENWVEPRGFYTPSEEPFACSKLKIVEIKCREFDDRVHQISRMLSIFNTYIEQINIHGLRDVLNI